MKRANGAVTFESMLDMRGVARRWVTRLVVVVGVVALVWVGLQVFPPIKTRSVAMPRAGAAPSEVVSTFMRALNAHDCRTARALAMGDEVSVATAWCHAVARISVRSISRPVYDSGDSGESVGNSAGNPTCMVAAGFNVRWRLFHSSQTDSKLGVWGFDLARLQGRGPWRIYDDGLG